MVAGLCREARHLKIRDGLQLRIGRWVRCLRMPEGGIHGLVFEVVIKLRTGQAFAAIPHDGSEEFDIGCGQRSPEHRQLA